MGSNFNIDDYEEYEEITDIEELKALHARRICVNCSNFFQECNDEPNFGVCIDEDVFEPFIDDMMTNGEAGECQEEYSARRYDGDRDACEKFTACEYVYLDDDDEEDQDDSEIDTELLHARFTEQYQNLNIPIYLDALSKSNEDSCAGILNQISLAISYGHESALDLLLDYYNNLGPVTELEETHKRINIIEILQRWVDDKRVIDALVNELHRSESNNITRRLYTCILNQFKYCETEQVSEPLSDLLSKKQYSNRMKKKIKDIINGIEDDRPFSIF